MMRRPQQQSPENDEEKPYVFCKALFGFFYLRGKDVDLFVYGFTA